MEGRQSDTTPRLAQQNLKRKVSYIDGTTQTGTPKTQKARKAANSPEREHREKAKD